MFQLHDDGNSCYQTLIIIGIGGEFAGDHIFFVEIDSFVRIFQTFQHAYSYSDCIRNMRYLTKSHFIYYLSQLFTGNTTEKKEAAKILFCVGKNKCEEIASSFQFQNFLFYFDITSCIA